MDAIGQMGRIRVVVVAGASATRHELRLLAAQLPGVDAVGESDGHAGLLDAVSELEADLLLIDAACLRPLVDGLRESRAPSVDGRPLTASPAARFAVKRPNGRITLVPVEEVLWLEAARDYVRLHTLAGSHLIRDTMSRLERHLTSHRFVRVHRSTIVRLDAVQEIRSDPEGRCLVHLVDGTKRDVSRAGRKRLQEAVGFSL